MAIEVGQQVEFPFAGKQMAGVVVAVHPKSVLLRADFPKHKGKLVRRKLHDFEPGRSAEPRRGFFSRLRGK